MVYKFRDRTSHAVPAHVVGERLDQIRRRHDGLLEPRMVVRDARPPQSPLHPEFEWNDRKAAHEFRLGQARDLIVSLVSIREDEDVHDQRPQFVYVGVGRPQEGSQFIMVDDMLQNEQYRTQVLKDCIRQLHGWMDRLSVFDEASEAILKIGEALDSLSAAEQPV